MIRAFVPGSATTALAVLTAALLAGCAQAEPASAPPTSSSASRAATPPPTQDVRTLEVTVTGTTVDPAPAQVDLGVGETLRLVVTADAGEAVHAHGFDDLEVPVTPGEPTTVELTGDVPGLYEVELHGPDLLLLQVAVR